MDRRLPNKLADIDWHMDRAIRSGDNDVTVSIPDGDLVDAVIADLRGRQFKVTTVKGNWCNHDRLYIEW